MSAHDEAGFPGYAEASPSPAAVSPSPALSAYSYASEASELDEGDDAQFSLDDWGMPSASSARHSSMGAEANGNHASSIHSRAATGSGSATPVNPGSGIVTKLSSPNVTPMNSRNGSSMGQAHGSALSPARAFEADQQQAAGSSRAGGSPLARPPAHQQDAGDMADAMDGDAGDEFDLQDEDEEDMHASGVPAARGWKLDARLSDTRPFKEKVLEMFSKVLSLAGWREADVDPALRPLSAEHLHLRRISGALTNAVFFVSYKPPSGASAAPPPTVLLRVYGVGTEVLLSRRGELLILHTLSSLYEIGPHILGTFANGRVEEYFPCEPIGKDGIRDLGTREEYINKKGELHVKGVEGTAQWVARRMRELHEVPLDVMRTVLEQGDLHAPSEKGFGRGIQNHIMACSHRPRNRRGSSRPRGVGNALPGMSALRDGLPGGRNLMRESPGPMQQVQTPEAMTPGAAPGGTSLRAIAAEGAKQAHEDNAAEAKSTDDALAAEWRAKFDINRNGSVTSVGSYGSAASFDSLATSFDSRASISSSASSDSRAGADEEDPSQKPTTPTSTAVTTPINPYFPAGPESKTERPPSASRSSSSNGSASRRPYPGVWRRMKRWSREAAKVLQLFDDFAQSPVGRAACKQALRSAPQEVLAAAGNIDETTGQEMDLLRTLSHKKLIASDMLSSTSGNLCNTLLCIVAMDFPRLMRELDTFKRFIRDWERREGQSKRVFAHNDSQYGNLLVVKPQPQAAASKGADELVQLPASGMPRNSPAPGVQSHQRKDSAMSTKSMSTTSTSASATPAHGSGAGIPARRGSTSQPRASKRAQPHQQVVVIDFEYASPNPRAYDIANHFHEWRVDYHHPTLSWSLTHHGAYPDKEQRHKWLRAYVQQGRLLRMRNGSSKSAAMLEYNSTPSSSQAQTPTEFSLGPPAIASAKPAPLDAAAASATLRRQQQGMPATSSPSLTPFLRGVCSPRSPWTTSDVTLPNGVANTSLARLDASIEREVERLEREVDMWSPASHAVWGLWGIVFGRAEIEAVVERVLEAAKDANAEIAAAGISVPDEALLLKAEEKAQEAGAEEAFDYLRYALGRIELFRYEVRDLGIV